MSYGDELNPFPEPTVYPFEPSRDVAWSREQARDLCMRLIVRLVQRGGCLCHSCLTDYIRPLFALASPLESCVFEVFERPSMSIAHYESVRLITPYRLGMRETMNPFLPPSL